MQPDIFALYWFMFGGFIIFLFEIRKNETKDLKIYQTAFIIQMIVIFCMAIRSLLLLL